MSISVLFDYLDYVDRKERPLTPIRSELRADSTFVETDQSCPDPSCSGTTWEEVSSYSTTTKICEQCSIVTVPYRWDDEPSDPYDEWSRFHENRPRYRNSNRRRQVGGFDHEWVTSDDTGSVADVPPDQFYRS